MMKKLVWILFVLISVSAFAQAESRAADSIRVIRWNCGPMFNNSAPLYVVDGMGFQEQPKWLNPKNIIDIKVMQSSDAIKAYGDKAKTGAIIITTKRK